jgi:hypothetical protein
MCSGGKTRPRDSSRAEGSLLFERQGKRYIDEVVIALRSSAAAARR